MSLIHLLQISDVLDLELATALAEDGPVIAWEPLRSLHPSSIPAGEESERREGSLRIRRIPLLRGFGRPPISWFAQTGSMSVGAPAAPDRSAGEYTADHHHALFRLCR